MVWPKLYSETAPTEDVKEGVAVGEEVGPEDGATEGPDDGAAVEGRDDGVTVSSDATPIPCLSMPHPHPSAVCC